MRRDIDRVRSPNVTSEPFAEVEGDRVDLCGTDIYLFFFFSFSDGIPRRTRDPVNIVGSSIGQQQ